MKRIKFDNLSKDWKLRLLIIFSIIFLFIGIFEIPIFNNSRYNELLIKIGFLFQVLFFGRMFVFKNYVQWNKKGIYIKVNRFLGINLNYEDIKSLDYQYDAIIVKKNNSKEVSIDLKGIDASDALKLFEILKKNSAFI